MKIALNQLNKLFASYGLQAIHARPIENGYVAQTNKGKRLVTIWDHFERLRWSNRWREILYRDGEQQTTRFLETRNKKKYIRYQGKYFVVSVFPEGRAIDPASEEECGVAGEIFARFHKALEKIDQKADAKSHFQLNEQYFANGSAVIQQVVGAIEKKTTPTLTDELIYANLPSLSHRFKTARQLWEGVNEPSSRFPLSFSRLDLNAITAS